MCVCIKGISCECVKELFPHVCGDNHRGCESAFHVVPLLPVVTGDVIDPEGVADVLFAFLLILAEA